MAEPDLCSGSTWFDDDSLFDEAKKMAKNLGRPVVVDHGGMLMTVCEDDIELDPEGWGLMQFG